MSVLSKTANKAAISGMPTPVTRAALSTVLDNLVDSYQDAIPQLTTAQIAALTPTLNMLVFNTDIARNQFYNGTTFKTIPMLQDAIPVEFTTDVEVDLDTHYLEFGDVVYGYGLAFGNLTPFGLAADDYFAKFHDYVVNADNAITLESSDTIQLTATNGIFLQSDSAIGFSYDSGISLTLSDTASNNLFEFRGDGVMIMHEYASFNFADDAAAAAGNIPLGGVYHNAGALRVRIV